MIAFSASVPVWACLPPPPGFVEPLPPTVDQRAAQIAEQSENIVYGELFSTAYYGRPGRFRILRVYKGSLRVGNRVKIQPSWGFDPPMCAWMNGGPFPTPKGVKGIFAWSGEPELKGVSEEIFASMVKQGLIKPTEVKQQ